MGWKRKKLESMNDEDINEVQLAETDAEEVPCCKAILAATSPVFKRMFAPDFREKKSY